MADPKPPSGPIKKSGDADLLKDLRVFRKEALNVSEEDEARWKEEARKVKPSGEPELPRGPVKAPPPRKRSFRYRKQVSIGLLVCAGLLALIQLDLPGRFRGAGSSSPSPASKSTPPSASIRRVMPLRVVVVRTPTLPAAFGLAQAYLVCRYETSLIGPGPSKKPVPGAAARATSNVTDAVAPVMTSESIEFDGDGSEGPASVFERPIDREPLARYRALLPGGSLVSRATLARQLAELVRKSTTPDDQLVSDALIGDPGPIADRGQALLARPSEGMLAGPVSLVTGLCLASHSPRSRGVARELLLRALREASLANPWPARALAMIDGARARPEEAIAPLTEWMARAPKDELTGYQLACLLVGARRLADALVVTQRLIGLPDGDAARLLGAWLALALGDPGRAQSFLAPLEADLAGKARSVEARVLALKGRILLAQGAAAAVVGPVLESSIAKDRGCTWALLPLGRLMVGTKRPEEAIAHYQQYLRLRPFSWEVHAEVVKLLEQTRFHAQALGEYRWLLGHVGRQRAWADGFLRMASELARPDLVRYEAVRH